MSRNTGEGNPKGSDRKKPAASGISFFRLSWDDLTDAEKHQARTSSFAFLEDGEIESSLLFSGPRREPGRIA